LIGAARWDADVEPHALRAHDFSSNVAASDTARIWFKIEE
jgi:hypothetical protein